jgi:hypothetical protein
MHGQYCMRTAAELKAMPLSSMTLYVTNTGSGEMDALLDTLLEAHWHLTPTYRFVDTAQASLLRMDTMALFLDQYLLIVNSNPYVTSMGSASFSGGSTLVRGVVTYRLRPVPYSFSLRGVLSDSYSTTGDMGYLVIARGGEALRERIRAYSMPSMRFAIARTDIAIGSHEEVGILYRFRVEQLIRDLVGAVDMTVQYALNGTVESLIRQQRSIYTERMGGMAGKRLLVVREWQTDKELDLIKKAYGSNHEVVSAADVDGRVVQRDGTSVVLVVFTDRLHVYDLATGDLVYIQKKKEFLTSSDLGKLKKSMSSR